MIDTLKYSVHCLNGIACFQIKLFNLVLVITIKHTNSRSALTSVPKYVRPFFFQFIVSEHRKTFIVTGCLDITYT